MPPTGYSSPRAAFFAAAGDYCRLPALAMAAAFVGYGAVVREMGFNPAQAVASTAGMVLIPSQIVMAELYQAAAGLATIFLAVAFVSARLLPMTVALMPLLREGRGGRFRFYALASLLATMSWTYSMRRGPTLPHDQRLAYFSGVAVMNYAVVISGTVVGYWLAGAVPQPIMRGLGFLVPVFFLRVFWAEYANRAVTTALLLGAILVPAIYLVSPEWCVLVGGLVGGTVAYALRRRLGASDDG